MKLSKQIWNWKKLLFLAWQNKNIRREVVQTKRNFNTNIKVSKPKYGTSTSYNYCLYELVSPRWYQHRAGPTQNTKLFFCNFASALRVIEPSVNYSADPSRYSERRTDGSTVKLWRYLSPLYFDCISACCLSVFVRQCHCIFVTLSGHWRHIRYASLET